MQGQHANRTGETATVKREVGVAHGFPSMPCTEAGAQRRLACT